MLIKRTLIALLFTLALTTGVLFAQDGDNSPAAQHVVALVAASEPFAELVAQYPNYRSYTEMEDGYWYVELFVINDEDEIWLGEAFVNADTLEIESINLGGDDFGEASTSPEAQAAIALVAASEDFVTLLAQFPNYEAYAFEEEAYIFVEFFAPGDEDDMFLGEAAVARDTLMIDYTVVAQFLTDAEIEARTPEVIRLAEADPAVTALLADLPATTPYVEYNPIEAAWLLYYENGLDLYEVIVGEPDDTESPGLAVLDINNVSEFDAAAREQLDRDRAVTLAFSADVFEEIDLPAAWFTRTTPLGNGLFGVDFITDTGDLLLQVIVDLTTDSINQVIVPGA
ncbi:MAG: hypothetical protein GYB67_08145 [Chloroflexi bacterium]|nr:hypothetical protein [Chloroflexota bacterium]